VRIPNFCVYRWFDHKEANMAIVTLTTDFGLADGYVGAMKGVILNIAPDATLVDISHEIMPQDVRGGAFVLKSASPYFPPGAIHVAVVDPGVGSKRRALAVQTERAIFIGPDNGVLSWALERETVQAIIHVDRPDYWLGEVSHTFHGRDIFAPVAAHLARGVPIHHVGTPVGDMLSLPLPHPSYDGSGTLHSEVIYIDRFGNLITGIELDPTAVCGDSVSCRVVNLPADAPDLCLTSQARVEIAGRLIHTIVRSYADVASGNLLALVDSSGHLEIAVRNGNAATALKAHVGAPVRVILQ